MRRCATANVRPMPGESGRRPVARQRRQRRRFDRRRIARDGCRRALVRRSPRYIAQQYWEAQCRVPGAEPRWLSICFGNSWEGGETQHFFPSVMLATPASRRPDHLASDDDPGSDFLLPPAQARSPQLPVAHGANLQTRPATTLWHRPATAARLGCPPLIRFFRRPSRANYG